MFPAEPVAEILVEFSAWVLAGLLSDGCRVCASFLAPLPHYTLFLFFCSSEWVLEPGLVVCGLEGGEVSNQQGIVGLFLARVIRRKSFCFLLKAGLVRSSEMERWEKAPSLKFPQLL